MDDVTQEVFLKAWRNMDSFHGHSSPKTWLFSIARHVAIDEMRKRSKEQEKQLKMQSSTVVKNELSAENLFFSNSLKRELYRAIMEMKTVYRDVLVLRGIKELTVQETAEVLEWSENKVRVTYHRAKKELGERMEGKMDGL